MPAHKHGGTPGEQTAVKTGASRRRRKTAQSNAHHAVQRIRDMLDDHDLFGDDQWTGAALTTNGPELARIRRWLDRIDAAVATM